MAHPKGRENVISSPASGKRDRDKTPISLSYPVTRKLEKKTKDSRKKKEKKKGEWGTAPRHLSGDRDRRRLNFPSRPISTRDHVEEEEREGG